MTTTGFARLARNPFERLFDALVEGRHRECIMALLLVCYAAVWSLYGAIAKGSQDLHFDIGEMFAWSHQVGLSSPTHPPLGAWLVRGWFAVMPRQDWSFYVLAMVVATAALWIAWRIAGRYLTAEKRVVGIMLLTFLPFYNFAALKYNASSVLTPFWAATTWWFLLSFETRRPGWAVLAGAGAAAAMLGKYWSIFLLAGLAVAALTDPRRNRYFRSPAPWLTIATGAVLLAPHLMWVAMHGFPTVSFAFTSHARTLPVATLWAFYFLLGVLGYLAAPIVLGALVTRPGVAAIGDTLWPADRQRFMLLIAFAVPLLLAPLVAIAARAQLDPLWSMSEMTLLPAVLPSSSLVSVDRAAAIRLLALAIIFPLLMVAASPVIAIVIHRQGVPNYEAHYRLIAQAVEQAWRARTDQPLRIVASNRPIADGSNFYFPGRPATYAIDEPARTPWVNDDRIAREGVAIVCPENDSACVERMNDYAVRYGAQAESVTLARSYFGTSDAPVRYQIVIIPPPRTQ